MLALSDRDDNAVTAHRLAWCKRSANKEKKSDIEHNFNESSLGFKKKMSFSSLQIPSLNNKYVHIIVNVYNANINITIDESLNIFL
jgi:hypothetical protein